MGIKIPQYRIKAKHDLKELRRRMNYGRHKRLSDELSLTSLIDMFSVIIFFLLQSFSATGEILLVNKDIELPKANYAKILERSPIVTVTKEKLFLEGVSVGSNVALGSDRIEFKWELPKLVAELKKFKNVYESINVGKKFPGDIIIQADKDLDFVYLKRVMYTLVQNDFSAINLVVRGEASFKSAESTSSL